MANPFGGGRVPWECTGARGGHRGRAGDRRPAFPDLRLQPGGRYTVTQVGPAHGTLVSSVCADQRRLSLSVLPYRVRRAAGHLLTGRVMSKAMRSRLAAAV